MRITNQMLNESARKAGLDLNRPTLLDYMNKNSNNPLYSALSKANGSSSDMMKNNYEKMQDSSKDLLETIERLVDEDEKSLFNVGQAENDYKDIYKTIESLIENYNNIIDTSKYMTGTLESFYNKMLKEIPADNVEVLNDVGVSLEKDDKLHLDMEKLKSSDIDTLKKVYGGDSEFVAKLFYVTKKIEDNANANAESLSNSYNSAGSINSVVNNRYDFWG